MIFTDHDSTQNMCQFISKIYTALLVHKLLCPNFIFKLAHNFLSYPASRQTDKQPAVKTLPTPEVAEVPQKLKHFYVSASTSSIGLRADGGWCFQLQLLTTLFKTLMSILS